LTESQPKVCWHICCHCLKVDLDTAGGWRTTLMQLWPSCRWNSHDPAGCYEMAMVPQVSMR
jgi:hypothetical protein